MQFINKNEIKMIFLSLIQPFKKCIAGELPHLFSSNTKFANKVFFKEKKNVYFFTCKACNDSLKIEDRDQ